MKVIFALMLVLASALGHAHESTLEKLAPELANSREFLVKSAMPFRRSLVVDELVEKMEMHDVDVFVSTKTFDGGALYFPGVILIGADVAKLPREELAFVLAHEYGHHTRMHWTSTLSRGAGLAYAAGKAWSTYAELHQFTEMAASPELNRHNELDADKAAILRLKSYGLYDYKAVISLLARVADPSDTVTHPSASARIAAILGIR